MKILVICQYYYPEPFRINDLCEALVEQGNDVTVITGTPNYPMGKIYPGYKNRKFEIINGVNVHRCFTVGRRSGTFWRFLNYYSYMFSSCSFINKIEDDFDVVLVYQLSPIMMANAAIKYKRMYNKKLVIYCLDLWPESLTTANISKDSLVYKYFNNVSSKIYKYADNILITSQLFSDYLTSNFGIPDERITYLPQYAESIFSLDSCKKDPDDTINLVFAGNVGTAQSVKTIILAAKETEDIQTLKWHIVGDGSDLENCKKCALELNARSVIFHDRKPTEEMPSFYKMADAMLITLQRNPSLSLTLPGKVQSYLAAGKPIIAALDGETVKIINESGCGLCAPAEDYIGLALCARKFCNSSDKDIMAANALRYYEKTFSKKNFILKLLEILKS